MKIVDVLQKNEVEPGSYSWIFAVGEVPKKYVDMAYEINKENGGYFEGDGLEIECVTKNGKIFDDCQVHLMYYFDDYVNIAVLNDNKDVMKCIEDFVADIGVKLPNSDDLGQIEYSEMIRELGLMDKRVSLDEKVENAKQSDQSVVRRNTKYGMKETER